MADKIPPLREQNAPWRNTPLDHWSTEIDPFIMSGDQWVDNDHDPGMERYESQKILNGEVSPIMAPFMHPTHDVSMGNNDRIKEWE